MFSEHYVLLIREVRFYHSNSYPSTLVTRMLITKLHLKHDAEVTFTFITFLILMINVTQVTLNEVEN